MGSQEFAQPVRGSGAQPIQTSAQGSIETDNYSNGGGFNFDGTDYPYTIDPLASIEVVHITDCKDVIMSVVTDTGNTFDIPLKGGSGVIDWVSMDSITFKDPQGTGGEVSGSWGGN